MADNYNINITNKNGIKLLTKDKKLIDDVKITIDKSLLGANVIEVSSVDDLPLDAPDGTIVLVVGD